MFPSISRLYLCLRGCKSIAKLDGGHGRISLGSAPGNDHQFHHNCDDWCMTVGDDNWR